MCSQLEVRQLFVSYARLRVTTKSDDCVRVMAWLAMQPSTNPATIPNAANVYIQATW